MDLSTSSVEAGIVTADVLRGWRRSPVFIRDTLFVPPGPEKVGAMIDLLFEEISGIEMSEGLLRAVLVHLWFAWIHPFPDGNGRVARFLCAVHRRFIQSTLVRRIGDERAWHS